MHSATLADRLRDRAPDILPSLLLCDFGHLADEIARLESAGIATLHLDVMDGNFVPNLTYGMPLVAAIRKLTDMPLDVHLMIERPERYISAFREAGADIITVHIEALEEPRHTLDEIRRHGAVAGLALNPATPLERIEPYLDACDLVLVMSVPAGFGGQTFHESALDKLARLRRTQGDRVLLEVDGGISPETIGRCAAAGAELFVVGSAIFRHEDYREAVAALRNRLSQT